MMKYIYLLSIFTITIFANSLQTNIFIKCDKNKDHFLNQEEYTRMSLKRFAKFDLSKDNQVDPYELSDTQLAKIMPQIAIQWFIRNDIDGNKIVTLDEAKNASNRRFYKLDKNQDNKLSMQEWVDGK